MGGLGLAGTVEAFNKGLGDGAQVALALSRSGLPDSLVNSVVHLIGDSKALAALLMLLVSLFVTAAALGDAGSLHAGPNGGSGR